MKETLQDGISRNSHREQKERKKNDLDIKESINRQERGRRRKAAIRRQKIRRRNVCIAIVAVLIILIFIMIKISSCTRNRTDNTNPTETLNDKTVEETIQETTSSEAETVTYKIEAPVVREKKEVYKTLKKYAKKDSKMAQLYNNRKLYTVELLNKVINNPEMTDFVLGYNDAEAVVTGGLTKKEKKADFPLFIQWDSRWAYVSYGDSNIGLAGCGPTCLSMVIFTLTRNEEATPYAIAKYSEENGFYVDGIGTAWSLMTDAAEVFGVDAGEIILSEENLLSELAEGKMLICAVGPGDFTTAGHFIVIYDYDAEGFCVNDPYCIARSEKRWSYEQLSGQIRAVWSYSYE